MVRPVSQIAVHERAAARGRELQASLKKREKGRHQQVLLVARFPNVTIMQPHNPARNRTICGYFHTFFYPLLDG